MSPSPITSLSVVVMTYNEEIDLDRCLASVAGLGDEIFILDSFSTDGTLEIAARYGARTAQHPFESYIRQKKRLIDMAAHDWVLAIDADEYLSDTLRASIVEARKQSGFDGYRCNRKNKIGHQWIHHGNWYPDRKIRLFDRRKVTIIGRDPHDVMLPAKDAVIGYLKGDLMHHADENMSTRFRTNEVHSTRAADALFDQGVHASLWRLVVKPCARFITAYLIKRGFLDGYYGWFIARSEAEYVWMREVKLWERWQRNQS